MTQVSKHVGVNIIYRENIVILICILVGCNKNNIKMHGTCIKIVVYLHCHLLRVKITITPNRKYVDNT